MKMKIKQPIIMSRNTAPYSTGLWIESIECGVETVHFDKKSMSCLFILPGCSHTSMQGAIELAKTLFPGVKLIGTCNETGWDAAYEDHGQDQWQYSDRRLEPDDTWPVMSAMVGDKNSALSECDLIDRLVNSGLYENAIESAEFVSNHFQQRKMAEAG